eukprot:353244-Chlamydomonas_euryale.AAC.14
MGCCGDDRKNENPVRGANARGEGRGARPLPACLGPRGQRALTLCAAGVEAHAQGAARGCMQTWAWSAKLVPGAVNLDKAAAGMAGGNDADVAVSKKYCLGRLPYELVHGGRARGTTLICSGKYYASGRGKKAGGGGLDRAAHTP